MDVNNNFYVNDDHSWYLFTLTRKINDDVDFQHWCDQRDMIKIITNFKLKKDYVPLC